MFVEPRFSRNRPHRALCARVALIAFAFTACEEDTGLGSGTETNGGGNVPVNSGSGTNASSGAGETANGTTNNNGTANNNGATNNNGAATNGGNGSSPTGADAGASGDASVANYDWGPGDYPPDLRSQTYLELTDVPGQAGKTRQYKVHVPESYHDDTPAPVLFALHGYQQNAVMFPVDGSSFVQKSEEEGFILVMPNGIQEDLIGGSWNAGVCCGEASAQGLDDVALMRAIFAEVQKHVNVDTARLYATGMSNGGFMAHRLACEAADLFAAVAPVAGSIGTLELGAIGTNPTPDFAACTPSRPISVLAVHGDADWIVPYTGMKPSLDHFAESAGCEMQTTPALLPESGGDTRCVTYSGCPQGVEITGCTVRGGGHCWFGDESCGTGAPGIGNLVVGNDSDFLDASAAAWNFLKRLRR